MQIADLIIQIIKKTFKPFLIQFTVDININNAYVTIIYLYSVSTIIIIKKKTVKLYIKVQCTNFSKCIRHQINNEQHILAFKNRLILIYIFILIIFDLLKHL